MSLKAELETWQTALQALAASPPDIRAAIAHFDKIGGTSKIECNIGILLAQLGKHLDAIARYRKAIELDDWLVIGWFQCGVSRFMLGKYEAAHRDFEAAHARMRGNTTINYTQLGLAHTIHTSEILFNRGLSLIYQSQTTRGLADLTLAIDGPHQKLVEDAIRNTGKGYYPFSIPTGTLFEPPQGKLMNLKPRDYMGKAVLITATSPSDAYTTFTGTTRLKLGQTPSGVPLPSTHPLARPRVERTSPSTQPVPEVSQPATSLLRSASAHSLRSMRSASLNPTRRLNFPRFASLDETTPRSGSFIHQQAESLLPYLPIFHPKTPPRKAPAPPGLTRLIIPSPPNPIPQTPIDDIDDYYSPQVVADPKDRFASPVRESPSSFRPSPRFDLGRSGSSGSSAGNALGLGRQGVGSSLRVGCEMIKIRIKVHISGQTRAMSLPATATLSDVLNSLRAKFSEMTQDSGVLFKDEDGDMLSIVDEGDWEAAVDVARIMGGKLELWVEL